MLLSSRFGEALRRVQDDLNFKNFYAFNPEFDGMKALKCSKSNPSDLCGNHNSCNNGCNDSCKTDSCQKPDSCNQHDKCDKHDSCHSNDKCEEYHKCDKCNHFDKCNHCGRCTSKCSRCNMPAGNCCCRN